MPASSLLRTALRGAVLLAAASPLPVPSSGQSAAEVYVHDSSGQLAIVDVDSGQVTLVGDMGVVMTDIAFATDGRLFGVDFLRLYEIDRRTAEVTEIGPHGMPGGNALVFGPDGTLYGMGSAGTHLYEVDPATGSASSLGNVGSFSAGDLAFVGSQLYLASLSNQLVAIDLGPPATGSPVGPFGFSSVYGLATSDARALYGIAGTQIFTVDLATGAGTFASDYSGQGLGVVYGSSFVGESFHSCPPAPLAGCVQVPSARLTFKGRAAGREKLALSMKRFAEATGQADFGDPVAGDTRYEVCLYGAGGDLAGGLGVARAGDSCGPKQRPCWKEKGEGWLYKNPDASPSGVRALALASGPAGKGRVALKAANSAKKLQTALPASIGPALAGETAVKVQVSASDARCFEADLTTIKKAESTLFKGSAP